jgi:hypothetical protein
VTPSQPQQGDRDREWARQFRAAAENAKKAQNVDPIVKQAAINAYTSIADELDGKAPGTEKP